MFYLHIWGRTKANYRYSYAMPFEDDFAVSEMPSTNRCWVDCGCLHLSLADSNYIMQLGGDDSIYSESDLSSISTTISNQLAIGIANDVPKFNQLVLTLFTSDDLKVNDTSKYITKVPLDQFK